MKRSHKLIITFANNNRKFDHCTLNSITIWDGLRMPKSERACMLLYVHISSPVLILYFASNLMRRLITKLVLRSDPQNPLGLGCFDITVKKLPFWEVTRYTANEEIFPISWKTCSKFRVHNRFPLLPILSHMYPVDTLLSHSL
jgi:hypothetical protein